MPKKPGLFAITSWLLKAAIMLSIFVIALLALTLGGILVVGTTFSTNSLGMPLSLTSTDRFNLMAAVGFAIVCSIICFGLVFFALRATAGIIETAISGDPFVTENAKRLEQVGWFLLAVEVIGALAHPIFNLLVARISADLLKQANLHFGDFGFGMSPVGILAVLLIFVSAQIFRRGSEMRAELETTV